MVEGGGGGGVVVVVVEGGGGGGGVGPSTQVSAQPSKQQRPLSGQSEGNDKVGSLFVMTGPYLCLSGPDSSSC